jgi:hypothetical protein
VHRAVSVVEAGVVGGWLGGILTDLFGACRCPRSVGGGRVVSLAHCWVLRRHPVWMVSLAAASAAVHLTPACVGGGVWVVGCGCLLSVA